MISDDTASTKVGTVRDQLDGKLGECLLPELCDDNPSGSGVVLPVGSVEEECGASIFHHRSGMGLIHGEQNNRTIGFKIEQRRPGLEWLL